MKCIARKWDFVPPEMSRRPNMGRVPTQNEQSTQILGSWSKNKWKFLDLNASVVGKA